MASDAVSDSVVVFALDDVRFALSMNAVERVVRAVEVSPLPDAPVGVLGMVNVHGRIMPVHDVRVRFGIATREVRVTDHLVIARTATAEVAILVDAAVDVVSRNCEVGTAVTESLPGFHSVQGLVMQGEQIVPIQDLTRFLPEMPRKNPELKVAA